MPNHLPAADHLTGTLAEIVGPTQVLTTADTRAGYERDWTGRWRGEALAVVRPADTAQVAAVVVACARAGAAIVPQGGNTGLVGGGVPRAEGAPGRAGRSTVVLSTRRLAGVDGVDAATAQLQAGAGTTLADAQRAARDAGLELALDLAARDSATLGGLVACDAGGLRALRHGTARRQLAGVEAVLADGSVVQSRMNGLLKDTAGYDLGALLCGSEGTLGVITAVRWSLQPRRDARATALVGLDDVGQAVELARTLRPALGSLEVCELMLGDGLALAAGFLGVAPPIDPPPAVAVLLQCAAPSAPDGAGAPDPSGELATALTGVADPERTVLAADAAGRERLFAIREVHADAIAAAGRPVKLDVGVTLDALPGFAERVGATARHASPGARVIVFGHLGDGNLHVNVLPAHEPTAAETEAVEDAVLGLVADCGGTVSAEHGIGVHKRRHLPLTRSAAELAAMRAIKHALDPGALLNPGAGL